MLALAIPAASPNPLVFSLCCKEGLGWQLSGWAHLSPPCALGLEVTVELADLGELDCVMDEACGRRLSDGLREWVEA